MNQPLTLRLSSHLTALRCLFLVAAHHGVVVPPEVLSAAGEGNTPATLLKLIQQVGLRGRLVRGRTWGDLVALGTAFPVLAERTDGTGSLRPARCPGRTACC